MLGMLRWEKGGPAAYSIKGGAGDFNEGGGNPRIIQATNTSPQVLFPCIYSPPTPLPLLSFWFLERFLSSFAVTSVRLLFPWRRLVSLPAQIALKHPIQQKKRESCFLAWVAEGGREEDAGGAGGEEPAGTTRLNINPISWRQREEG